MIYQELMYGKKYKNLQVTWNQTKYFNIDQIGLYFLEYDLACSLYPTCFDMSGLYKKLQTVCKDTPYMIICNSVVDY